jgi:hypothetical protein
MDPAVSEPIANGTIPVTINNFVKTKIIHALLIDIANTQKINHIMEKTSKDDPK